MVVCKKTEFCLKSTRPFAGASPSTAATLALFLLTSSSEIFQGQPCLISATVASSLKPSFSLKGAMRSSNLLMLQDKQMVLWKGVQASLEVRGRQKGGVVVTALVGVSG